MANYRLDQFGLWNRVYPLNFPANVASYRGSTRFAMVEPDPRYPFGFPKRSKGVFASTRRRRINLGRRIPFNLAISSRYATRRSGYSRRALGSNVRYRRGPRGKFRAPRRGTFTRKRVLNPISQSRVIRIRQQMSLAIADDADSATAHALETYNGLGAPVLKLAVTTQPYSVLAINGTVKPFHSVSQVADGSADHFGIRAVAGSAAYDADIIAIVKRYASFRVAAMKVTLMLNEEVITDAGADANWINASRALYVVRTAFDRLDTQQVMPEIDLGSAALAYPTAP